MFVMLVSASRLIKHIYLIYYNLVSTYLHLRMEAA